MSVMELINEIDTLPAPERWQVLEHTRHTLESELPDESPQWHAAELDATASRLAEGREEILDWSAAKRELRQRFSS